MSNSKNREPFNIGLENRFAGILPAIESREAPKSRGIHQVKRELLVSQFSILFHTDATENLLGVHVFPAGKTAFGANQIFIYNVNHPGVVIEHFVFQLFCNSIVAGGVEKACLWVEFAAKRLPKKWLAIFPFVDDFSITDSNTFIVSRSDSAKRKAAIRCLSFFTVL